MHEQLTFIYGELRSALRFRWIGLLATWLICLGGWLYVASMPDIYEAQARFFLDTSSLLAPVLQDQIVASDSDAQLTFMRESLLGDEELETVIRAVGLDANIQDALAYEALLNGLRNDILFVAIDPSAGQRAAPGTEPSGDRIFNLRYRHQSRDKAIAVVSALIDTFIEGALGETRQNEDDALVFVDAQIAVREAELKRQERAITDFRRANADRLPGAQGDYLERLQTENEALAEARRQLRSLQSRREQHVQQIERLREVVPSSGSSQPTNSLVAAIIEAQREVDRLALRYTDVNPDLIAARQTLDSLRQQRAAELEALGLENADLALLELEANPVYVDAQIALNETELSIAELESAIQEREANIVELTSLIDESLENETQFAELERTLEVNNEEYLELVRSRQSLILTLQTSASEQLNFRSIVEPNASLNPVEPNRLMMIFAVFVFAVGAGGALCYGLAQLRPVFSSTSSLRTFAGQPVLGTVTNAWPVAERIAFRSELVKCSVVFALLFVVFVGVVGVELLGPGIHAPFRGA